MKGDKILDELHKIREKHWKERKHLSPEEYAKVINKEGKEAAKRLGIRVKSPQSVSK